MSSKPIVTVFGATGAQGGSVVRYLAEDGTFQVRAVTRDPNSASAKKLKEKYPGIEVVKGDLNDKESIRAVLKGAYGVFAVTNFWEAFNGEIKQGKDVVDAAKEAGTKHFIWSTLDKSDPEVPHFVSKWHVHEYLKASGVPRTSLWTAFYQENFISDLIPMVKKIGDHHYQLQLPIMPDYKIFTYPASETGFWVLAALKDPKTWIGKDMRLVTEWLSARDMAEIASRVSGNKVEPLELDREAFEQTQYATWPGAKEFYLNMILFMDNGPESGIRNQETTLKLYPQCPTFEQFVKANQDKMFK